uniref:Uncharacterized protein n=3 Tax=Aegilops tauschii subsp. strangulata TaxID=200361 RepID=A0A453PBL1_AEGTS
AVYPQKHQSVSGLCAAQWRRTPSVTMLKALPARFLVSPEPGGRRRSPRPRSLRPISAALMTNPAYFEVGRLLGSYGFMNITSYSSSQSGGFPNDAVNQDLSLGYSPEEIERLRVQDVGEGQVKISLLQTVRGKSGARSIEGHTNCI